MCTLTPTPVVGLDHVVQVATDFLHSCAVRDDGEVWCWGNNFDAALGDGTMMDRATPVRTVGLPPDVVEVATGNMSSCARTSGGEVWCWGLMTSGIAEPRKLAGISNAVEIGMGVDHACVRLGDGHVQCWGSTSACALFVPSGSYQIDPITIPNLENAVDLSVSGSGTIIARADGSLLLNIGGCNDDIAALGAGVRDAVHVAGGGGTACYIDRAGAGHCLGGTDGALGDGTKNQQLGHFVTMISGKLRQLGAGDGHTCAIDEIGRASCCGLNQFGEIGDGTTVERDVLTPVRF